jgi:hydroxyethylthiazole kinase
MDLSEARIEEVSAALLGFIRERRPVIHHLANFVSMRDVALVTRALGAFPIMAMAPEEVEEVVINADALVVNLGTPTADRLEAIHRVVPVARARGLPIIVDPVGVGGSRLRTSAAKAILAAAGRTVIRANSAEAAGLVGLPGVLRGVEAVSQDANPTAIAAAVAAQFRAVVAVTGARDIIADGVRTVAIDNGHPWLAAVTGAGCMATAVIGTFCAVAPSDLVGACACALGCFGLASERAASRAGGPGTLLPLLVDALFALTPTDLRAGIRSTNLVTTHAT